MKKFLCIGCFILCLSLLLLFSVNIKGVNAGTPTPTGTLEMELWFQTPTPEPLGSCPNNFADPNLDLTYKYKNLCEHCIQTGTPAFVANTPTMGITSTGTITPVPTNTPQPTATPTLVLGNFNVQYRYDRNVPSPWVQKNSDAFWNTHRQYDIVDETLFTSSNNAFPHKIGVQFYGEETVMNYYGYNINHQYTIKAGIGTQLKVTFYTGKNANTTVNVPSGGSISTYIYNTSYQGNATSWYSWNETFDVEILNNGSSGYEFLIWNNKMVYQSSLMMQDYNYKWSDGGTFYFPPQEGYCRVPEENSSGMSEDWFKNNMYPFWIGSGSCVSTQFMIDFLNSQIIQDILTLITGQETPIDAESINMCFRQFSFTPLKIFGLTIDVMFFLYTIVGVYIGKALIGLIT